MVDESLFIAKIQSAGKNGFIKIQLIPGFYDNLNKFRYLFLDFWNQKKKFELEEIVTNKSSVYLKFKYFNDERDISVLLDREIFVLVSELKKLNLNYISENNVVGFLVFKNQKKIGIVKEFFEATANQILELQTEDGKEILIPFVKDVFEKIDYQNKELVIKSDFGLDDDED